MVSDGDAARYTLMETLGEGSFGKVKLAVDKETNGKVAIKIVQKDTIADVEDVERVYRETFILTTLKHENIIKLIEVYDTPTSIHLVMEYAEGGELLRYFNERQSIPEVEACSIFKQICAGVEYCHRKHIIHRDLKLENVLLDDNGNVKIADFGLSNTIKFDTMNTFCGTPGYTSPEQIDGGAYVGNAVDIWAMGVILFCLVCGFLPFEASSIPALFFKIKHRLFKIPEFVSAELADLINKMLASDPEVRYKLSDIRNHAWNMMGYTGLEQDLLDRPSITATQIDGARAECLEVGEVFARQKALEAKKERRRSKRASKKLERARSQPHTYTPHNNKNNHNNHNNNQTTNGHAEGIAATTSTTSTISTTSTATTATTAYKYINNNHHNNATAEEEGSDGGGGGGRGGGGMEDNGEQKNKKLADLTMGKGGKDHKTRGSKDHKPSSRNRKQLRERNSELNSINSTNNNRATHTLFNRESRDSPSKRERHRDSSTSRARSSSIGGEGRSPLRDDAQLPRDSSDSDCESDRRKTSDNPEENILRFPPISPSHNQTPQRFGYDCSDVSSNDGDRNYHFRDSPKHQRGSPKHFKNDYKNNSPSLSKGDGERRYKTGKKTNLRRSKTSFI